MVFIRDWSGYSSHFTTVLAKPDFIIATLVPPTVNHEIDYNYIARLSADAMPGWLASYEEVKQTYVLAQRENQATPSAEVARRVWYASQIATDLQMHYRGLASRYGSFNELFATYDLNEQEQAIQYFEYMQKRGWLEQNEAGKRAYYQLKRSINIKEHDYAHVVFRCY